MPEALPETLITCMWSLAMASPVLACRNMYLLLSLCCVRAILQSHQAAHLC